MIQTENKQMNITFGLSLLNMVRIGQLNKIKIAKNKKILKNLFLKRFLTFPIPILLS